ncbi:hypothetical protein BH11ARM2_BH11ARM2_21060 [soil metagenome]
MKLTPLPPLAVALATMLAALSFADVPCNYHMSTAPDGTPCNTLPSPHPQTSFLDSYCDYPYCNHGVLCPNGTGKYQRMRRTRPVYKWVNTQSPYNTVYYTDTPSDTTDGCCGCTTNYIDD